MKKLLLICLLLCATISITSAGLIDQNSPQSVTNTTTTFSAKEMCTHLKICKYTDIRTFRKRLKLNQSIISKQDFIISGSITDRGNRIQESSRLETPLLHSYQYQNISLIFGKYFEPLTETGKSNITSIFSGGIQLVMADTGETSTTLAKIYDYSGSTLSGAMDYISSIVPHSSTDCIVTRTRPEEIRGDKWENYFVIQPSDTRWRGLHNTTREEFYDAADNLSCYDGFGYYTYLRYPQLHKVFAVLSRGKDGGEGGKFRFVGIRNSSGLVELSYFTF